MILLRESLTQPFGAGTVFGSDTAELLLADDGQSLYVSGGELSVSHPNINVLRRYPDGRYAVVERVCTDMDADTLGVVRVAVSRPCSS